MPISMPDLHGVPLPYTALDKMIESLFGPTVVRPIKKIKIKKDDRKPVWPHSGAPYIKKKIS